MEIMKVVGWRCTDGEYYEHKEEAEKHQNRLNALHKLTYLVQDNCHTTEEVDLIYDFIDEHRVDLYEIIKALAEI